MFLLSVRCFEGVGMTRSSKAEAGAHGRRADTSEFFEENEPKLVGGSAASAEILKEAPPQRSLRAEVDRLQLSVDLADLIPRSD